MKAVPAAAEFRAVMRHVPTGVTVVTTMLDGKPKGFTANAFASVSADPPTILICVNRSARTHPLIAQAGRFCVNLLQLAQQHLAERFASHDTAEPFAGVAYDVAESGSPVLAGTLAFFDCTLDEEHTAGTHTIFIGRVVACGASDGAPLGYFNAAYKDFKCSIP